MVVLLGGEDADALADAQAVKEHVVGVDVELLLDLALNVDLALAPRMSLRPARRTFAWIILVARVIPDNSHENSPEAPGKRFWSWRMCC